MKVTPIQSNALDLSMFEYNTFDVALNMGLLYHLKSEEERIQAINEAIRVCKKRGRAFFLYF